MLQCFPINFLKFFLFFNFFEFLNFYCIGEREVFYYSGSPGFASWGFHPPLCLRQNITMTRPKKSNIMKKFIFSLVAVLVSMALAGAQSREQSTTTSEVSSQSAKTTILQTITVPDGVTIHTGTTRTGNTKYYIVFSADGKTINVWVTESLATKYKNGQAKIEVVKRKDNTTGRITYTSRTLGGRTKSQPTDINLSNAKFN